MTMQRKQQGTSLSPRETQIVQMASRGLTDPQIAIRLGISLHTVRDYWRCTIKPALGARDRTHAVAIAVRSGIADPYKEAL